MEKIQHTMWQALIHTRDHIVDRGIEAWKAGADHEALMERMCKDWNVEPYIVFDHFKECVKFISTPVTTY
jgi:hypothetical protein